MLAPHLVVGHPGMNERDLGLVSVCFHRDGDGRFGALGTLRHPCVFDAFWPVDVNEAPEMRPGAALVLYGKIEQTIHNRIHDQPLGTEPGPAGACRVHPDVENCFCRCGNRAGHCDFGELHRDLSLFAAKNFSSWSRRALQNSSYFRIHRLTTRRGWGDNSRVLSRPERVRLMRPACSSTFTCLQNPVSDIGKGAAIAETRAGPRARRSMMARRVGSEIAAATRSIFVR